MFIIILTDRTSRLDCMYWLFLKPFTLRCTYVRGSLPVSSTMSFIQWTVSQHFLESVIKEFPHHLRRVDAKIPLLNVTLLISSWSAANALSSRAKESLTLSAGDTLPRHEKHTWADLDASGAIKFWFPEVHHSTPPRFSFSPSIKLLHSAFAPTDLARQLSHALVPVHSSS
jgi:hypothetical protein